MNFLLVPKLIRIVPTFLLQELPSNFALVMKDFTREVLRAQPADIYEFAARYFTALAEQQARFPL